MTKTCNMIAKDLTKVKMNTENTQIKAHSKYE